MLPCRNSSTWVTCFEGGKL